jgi:hypothetical protein
VAVYTRTLSKDSLRLRSTRKGNLLGGVRLRGPWRRHQASRAEALHPPSEIYPVDRVAVTDKETRRLVVPVAHRLDEGLRGILSARRRCDSHAHHLAASEVQDDECVEKLEAHGDDREPVASPSLPEMVTEKGRPLLASATRQIRRSVLGHRPRGHMVTKLGKLGSNHVLTPQRIYFPHPVDQGSGIRIDGWATYRPSGSMAPEQTPERAMPANHGVGAYDRDGLQEPRKDPGDGGDAPPVARLEVRPRGALRPSAMTCWRSRAFSAMSLQRPRKASRTKPRKAWKDSRSMAKHYSGWTLPGRIPAPYGVLAANNHSGDPVVRSNANGWHAQMPDDR